MADRTGTAGNDTLDGTTQDDRLEGLSGSDSMSSGAGNDTVSGGEGSDVLAGGDGNDVIYGFGASDRTAGSGDIVVERVVQSPFQPVFLTAAPGDPDQVYVVTKGGGIRILDPETGTFNATPFLSIPASQLQTDGEQGLLGLAFHPDYAANGRFFVFLTNAAGNIEVREYARSAGNPDIADASSGNVILTIPHPGRDNHNGGWIGFGPDGYLYIATGDGGGGGDPDNNAQNVNSLLGKMLRIDVNGDDFAVDSSRDYAIPDDNPFANGAGADEIWAVGLRNPWRNSFDRLTGDLYIADVGQGLREEINFQPGGAQGGANYGWVIKEGTLVFNANRPGNLPPDSPLLVDPVFENGHSFDENGGFSVTGGYVYRGTGPGMQGVYFYADFVTDNLWSLRVVDGQVVDQANRTDQLTAAGMQVDNIASFGEDARGNLYIVGLDGEIFRITPGEGAGDGADLIRAGAGRDTAHGGAGDDTLQGGADDDRLFGGSQDDILDGGLGRDRMAGGTGADVFDFNATAESGAGGARPDSVADFTQGEDVVDISTIDAQAAAGGNQAFGFISTARFTAEGQVRLKQSGADTIIQINTSGSDGAEMSIRLIGVQAGDVTAADFVL
jgi:Ca2+-binding RTX toxin-like protein